MDIRFAFRSISPSTWRLASSVSIILLAFLFLALTKGVLGVIVVCGVGMWLFLKCTPERRIVLFSFVLFLATSIISVFVFPLTFSLFSFLILSSLIFGLMDGSFARREECYLLFQTILLFVFFLVTHGLLFSFSLPSLIPFVWGGVVLGAVREFLLFYHITYPMRVWACAGVAGLLVAENVWITVLLPLTPLFIVIEGVLIVVLLRDVVLAHFRGELTKIFFMRHVGTFLVFLFLLFAFISWRI